MPFPSTFTVTLPGATTVEETARRLNATLEPLDLQWKYRPSMATGVGFARANVWSRAARRQQQKVAAAAAEADDTDEEDEPALGFKVQLRLGPKKQETEMAVRWLRGHDSVLFESFCGMLKRQVGSF